MRYLITTILLAVAAPLSWGEVPDAFWEENFNFPYLCVTTGTYETSVNDAGRVAGNDNDSFIVRETGVTRIGETEKTSVLCQETAVTQKEGGYAPEVVCQGARKLEIFATLDTKVLSPFVEIHTLYGKKEAEDDFEPIVRLRTGKCSPINQ